MPRTSTAQREELSENIRRNIIVLLKLQDKTQTGLCEYLGFTCYNTYQRRMDNAGKITIEELFKIANYLNVKPQTLIFGKASILSIGQ